MGYHPAREWEDNPLPQVANGAQAISWEVVKMALQVHHTQFLHSLGIDAYSEYQQNKAEYILEAVQPNSKTCKVSGEKKSSTQASHQSKTYGCSPISLQGVSKVLWGQLNLHCTQENSSAELQGGMWHLPESVSFTIQAYPASASQDPLSIRRT